MFETYQILLKSSHSHAFSFELSCTPKIAFG